MKKNLANYILPQQQGQPVKTLRDEGSDDVVIEHNLDFNKNSELCANDSDDFISSIRWPQDGPNYIGKYGNTLCKSTHNPKITRIRRHNIISIRWLMVYKHIIL